VSSDARNVDTPFMHILAWAINFAQTKTWQQKDIPPDHSVLLAAFTFRRPGTYGNFVKHIEGTRSGQVVD
jgi:hypothetical protein